MALAYLLGLATIAAWSVSVFYLAVGVDLSRQKSSPFA
jgi:hypothetical protein